MPADDFARVGRQIGGLMKDTLPHAMDAVVLQGVAIMKREAPRKSGRLSRSIAGRVEQGGKRGVVDTHVPYARAVDEGSKKYIIRPKQKQALFWKGARHPVRLVTMPARKGQHFKQRTVDRLRPIAERELSTVYGAALGKIQ